MSIYEKLLKVQQELKCNKSQYNSFGKYNYRNCEDILESVKPLLKEAKAIIVLSDTMESINERYYVKAEAKFIDIEDGSQIVNSAYAREDEKKTGMDLCQVSGAASSYARKYALNGLLAIDDTKDSDTTNTGESKKSKVTPKAPIENIEEPVCECCGRIITDKIAKFSMAKYHRELCMECQKIQ